MNLATLIGLRQCNKSPSIYLFIYLNLDLLKINDILISHNQIVNDELQSGGSNVKPCFKRKEALTMHIS